MKTKLFFAEPIRLFSALLLFAMALITFSCMYTPPFEDVESVYLGTLAPAFELQRTTGPTITWPAARSGMY